MPNRRRRRLSTAMSAVAALAVASPAAVVAVSDLSDSTKPPTEHRQFVQAAMVTDLPNELMSALSQGLSQFGINLPPMPTSLVGREHTRDPDLAGPHDTGADRTGPHHARPDHARSDHAGAHDTGPYRAERQPAAGHRDRSGPD